MPLRDGVGGVGGLALNGPTHMPSPHISSAVTLWLVSIPLMCLWEVFWV